MPLTVVSASFAPAVIPPGGQATVTPVLSNPDGQIVVAVHAGGTVARVTIPVHEAAAFSTDPTTVDKPGFVTAVIESGGGSLAWQNGQVIVTAPPAT